MTVPLWKKETVSVTFVCSDGTKLKVDAAVGDNLLDVVIDNDVDLDGFGACEGTLACSTCHLVFDKADYDRLPSEPCDEELDMLDLAYGITDTSRLGCQVIVSKDMEGLVVSVPAGVADAREPS
ncbi:ADXH2-like protein [Mya arenaria]|uniref:ADXH2-like protein n=2 Tax=Mya arenaria TaxID=6604 RepID=A0ABY7EF66_MYAAR|nr:ADXH2-like protein [Mya arenaria]